MLKNTYRNLLISLILLLASYPFLIEAGLWGRVVELSLATAGSAGAESEGKFCRFRERGRRAYRNICVV